MTRSILIQDHACPVCKTINDAVLSSDDVPVFPAPGDLSICIECFAIGVFTDDGRVRVATSEECNEVPEWLRIQLAARERGKPS